MMPMRIFNRLVTKIRLADRAAKSPQARFVAGHQKTPILETTWKLIVQPHTTECASLAGIRRLQFGRIDVPKFYFHQHLNGRFVEDRCGRQFPSVKEACEHAVRRTPVVLRKVAAPTGNTYLATEISDGNS